MEWGGNQRHPKTTKNAFARESLRNTDLRKQRLHRHTEATTVDDVIEARHEVGHHDFAAVELELAKDPDDLKQQLVLSLRRSTRRCLGS